MYILRESFIHTYILIHWTVNFAILSLFCLLLSERLQFQNYSVTQGKESECYKYVQETFLNFE